MLPNLSSHRHHAPLIRLRRMALYKCVFDLIWFDFVRVGKSSPMYSRMTNAHRLCVSGCAFYRKLTVQKMSPAAKWFLTMFVLVCIAKYGGVSAIGIKCYVCDSGSLQCLEHTFVNVGIDIQDGCFCCTVSIPSAWSHVTTFIVLCAPLTHFAQISKMRTMRDSTTGWPIEHF